MVPGRFLGSQVVWGCWIGLEGVLGASEGHGWGGGFPGVMGVPGVVKGPWRGEVSGVLGSPGDLGGPDVQMTSCVYGLRTLLSITSLIAFCNARFSK